MSALTDDARARPELFQWNGPIAPAAFEAWLTRNPWARACPGDLVSFWQATGGGEAFETETLLGPLSNTALGDDINVVNRELRSRGMSPKFVVFHVGLLISAIDTDNGNYVELDQSDFHPLRRFSSLDKWYEATLRMEYAERYGMPARETDMR